MAAAKRFFGKAMKNNVVPRVLTSDAHAALPWAVTEMKPARVMPLRVEVRSNKCLNKAIEQHHRRIKHTIASVLGFERFDTATITISGVKLAAKIRKHQFKIGKLTGRPRTARGIWAAVLAV